MSEVTNTKDEHIKGLMTDVVEEIKTKEPDIIPDEVEQGVEIITKMVNLDSNIDFSAITEGVQYIIDGYFEYVQEVVRDRALADLRDGLKPVNRRIIYTLKTGKYKNNIKSAKLVGDVMGALHPHGDASIYEALVLMTEDNGSLAFPLIHGTGNFGGVYKTDPPAAMRYTEVSIHENTAEYFGEMNGITMKPNFDNTTTEPDVLPVSFPSLLVNSTSGIAVGFRSNIPSFNFIDVCNLVKEYIKDGKCSTIIYPDFVTGGYVVKNDKETLKIMKYGKGKIKLRGRAVIQGKEIAVTEVPYGKTIQGLLKQINEKEIKSIKNAYDADDFDSGLMFNVECKSKAAVDEALQALYRETDFQYSYSSDITVVEQGEPKRLGVWGVIDRWVQWRRQVILKEMSVRKCKLEETLSQSKAFMEVIKYPELKEQLAHTIVTQGQEKGYEFVLSHYDNSIVTPELARWVCSRRINDFYTGGKYADEYNAATNEIKNYESIIADVDAEICRQMDTLIKKYGKKLKRKTEITDTDYVFNQGSASHVKIKDTTPCHYDFKDGFLRKLKTKTDTPNLKFEFDGICSDTLIGFDNRGRLLRVYCNDIPLGSPSDMGTYLPRYFGYDETDDYRITYLDKLDGSTLMLIYSDGNIGFVDETEWTSNTRSVKVLEKGIATGIADCLGAVVNISELHNVDEYMLFVGDNKDRIGWVYVKDIARKHRTAKTRVFNMLKRGKITHYYLTPANQGALLLNNLDTYYGKMKKLNHSDFNGNPAIFSVMQ